MELPVHARFRAWFAWSGLNQGGMAKRLGCNQSVVSNVLAGKRRVVSIDIAASIERESGDWPKGPIYASEWALASKRKRCA